MIWITHVVFGLVLGVFFKSYTAMDNLAYFTMIVLFSLLPDIDTHESKVGRRTPIVSHIIEKIFGHRGLFHSPIALFVFTWFVHVFLSREVAYVFLIGYGSHLLIDSLTKSGINLLYPFTTLKLKGFVQTSSALEYFILFLLIAVLGLLATP